jgi:hypothetical protein
MGVSPKRGRTEAAISRATPAEPRERQFTCDLGLDCWQFERYAGSENPEVNVRAIQESPMMAARRWTTLLPVILASLTLTTMGAQSARPPQAEITNGPLKVLVYLPDAKIGFFKGTRFDWAGVIGRLEFEKHVFYAPWFTGTDPALRDYTATATEVIAGPNTAVTGPVEEFQRNLGFDDAKPGGTFMKIGVGVLRKPEDGAAYSNYRLYDIVDVGRRTVEPRPDAVTFTQDVRDPASGYGYAYTKTVRLLPGRSEMRLEHSLRNTGTRRIENSVYNHNFLTIDGRPVDGGYVIKAPYDIKSTRPPASGLAEIRGRDVVYLKPLTANDVVSTPLQGFGSTAADYDFRVEHTGAGVGVRMTADRPMSNAALWSMRTTIAVEPFIAIALDPGQEFTWTLTYTYYTLPLK